MAQKRSIPEKTLRQIISRFLYWRGEQLLSTNMAGAKVRDEFPEIFGESQGHSVYEWTRRAAQELGIDTSLNVNVLRAQVPPSNDTFAIEQPETWFEYSDSAIVLSDSHFPLHDTRGGKLVLETIAAKGIDTAIWNGDTLDNAYKGHKGRRNVRAPSLTEGLHAAAQFIDGVTMAGVTRHVFLAGNHDDKIWRDTDQEWDFEDVFERKIAPLLKTQCERIVAKRYYAIMRAPMAGGIHFRFTHQKEYRRAPLSTAKGIFESQGVRLNKHGKVEVFHIFTGHQHHLAHGFHPNGIVMLADCGTLQNPELVEYKRARDTTHPQFNCGFMTLERGIPRAHSFSYSDEWWDKELGR